MPPFAHPVRPARRRLLAASALTLALVVSACGSASDDAASTEIASLSDDDPTSDDGSAADDAAGGEGSGAGDVDPEEAFTRYEQCMAKHGIDVSFSSGGAGVDDPSATDRSAGGQSGDAEAAQEECDPILEDAFGSYELSPEEEAEQADQMLKVDTCLREKGFDINLSSGTAVIPGDVDLDAMEKAMSDCFAQMEAEDS